jgi:hypothetical protein
MGIPITTKSSRASPITSSCRIGVTESSTTTIPASTPKAPNSTILILTIIMLVLHR